jgi:hypothetical protein
MKKLSAVDAMLAERLADAARPQPKDCIPQLVVGGHYSAILNGTLAQVRILALDADPAAQVWVSRLDRPDIDATLRRSAFLFKLFTSEVDRG